mmetsp:Transcript_29666/g.58236  ORF Transcript_29666/g.58236 Transcript_29666/m.58236 type:complete len:203 (-) Transcript_29666:308-916(-)
MEEWTAWITFSRVVMGTFLGGSFFGVSFGGSSSLSSFSPAFFFFFASSSSSSSFLLISASNSSLAFLSFAASSFSFASLSLFSFSSADNPSELPTGSPFSPLSASSRGTSILVVMSKSRRMSLGASLLFAIFMNVFRTFASFWMSNTNPCCMLSAHLFRCWFSFESPAAAESQSADAFASSSDCPMRPQRSRLSISLSSCSL